MDWNHDGLITATIRWSGWVLRMGLACVGAVSACLAAIVLIGAVGRGAAQMLGDPSVVIPVVMGALVAIVFGMGSIPWFRWSRREIDRLKAAWQNAVAGGLISVE